MFENKSEIEFTRDYPQYNRWIVITFYNNTVKILLMIRNPHKISNQSIVTQMQLRNILIGDWNLNDIT